MKKESSKKPSNMSLVLSATTEEQTSQELPSAGLGDTIKSITSFLGIEQCEPCKKRQERLNNLFPYLKLKRDINAEELALMKRINEGGGIIQNADANQLFKTYNELFNTNLQRCNCSGLVKQMVTRINKWIDNE